jgi:hypothetical protein
MLGACEMSRSSFGQMQIPGYDIKSVVGRGGMSTVFVAVQESLGRDVALKVMNPTFVTDGEFQKRFLNEGRIVARLRHPNIVVIYDVGVHQRYHYLSMSYLPGGTLKERITSDLSLSQKLAIVDKVADALAYAHARGIVHRDIKPQNILFDEDDSPVLTDFGIAKSASADTKITTTGTTLGSIPYMSPEQVRSAAVDHRADLYSFGVVFWELLTGELPYTAETQFALAFKHINEPIPKLPPALAPFQQVMNRLLAKTPEERYPSVAALKHALDAISLTPDAESGPPPDLQTTMLNPSGWSAGAEFPPATRGSGDPTRKRQLWLRPVVGASVALTVLAVAAYFVLGPFGPSLRGVPSGTGAVTGGAPAVQTRVEPPTGRHIVAPLPESEGAGSGQGSAAAPPQGPDRLSVLRAQAARQWQAGNFVAPPGNNAFETYRAILRLEPDDTEAAGKLLEIGRIQLGRRALEDAERLLREGRRQEALHATEIGLRVVPHDGGLLAMRDRLRNKTADEGH